MKVRNVLQEIDEVKPNAFSSVQKRRWIARIEGQILTEVWLCDTEEIAEHLTMCAENGETELCVEAPFDEIYAAYLSAQIDMANEEYSKAANNNEVFNNLWGGYVRYFATKYEPAYGRMVELGEIRGQEGEATLAFLMPGQMILRTVCRVEEPFGAGTEIRIGTEEEDECLMPHGALTPETEGRYGYFPILRAGTMTRRLTASVTGGDGSGSARVCVRVIGGRNAQ